MELQLNLEEQKLLAEILRQNQRELLLEISHADHHPFKVALRERERMLEEMLKKLYAGQMVA